MLSSQKAVTNELSQTDCSGVKDEDSVGCEAKVFRKRNRTETTEGDKGLCN